MRLTYFVSPLGEWGRWLVSSNPSVSCSGNSFALGGETHLLPLSSYSSSPCHLGPSNFGISQRPSRLDYQPLFGKGARAPPLNSRKRRKSSLMTLSDHELSSFPFVRRGNKIQTQEHWGWQDELLPFLLIIFFSLFLRVRVGKPKVDSEVSIEDKGGNMEMDVVNYGYHKETTPHV